jgi:hypothetical protein
MHEPLVVGFIVESTALLALLIAMIALRRIGKDEIARSKGALRAESARLWEAMGTATAKGDEALRRIHEAEIGLARVSPQLDSLARRVDELHAAVTRCATSDQLVQVLGRLEAMALANSAAKAEAGTKRGTQLA